jgi:hypothetical protein
MGVYADYGVVTTTCQERRLHDTFGLIKPSSAVLRRL